jgi:hypothetical protein
VLKPDHFVINLCINSLAIPLINLMNSCSDVHELMRRQSFKCATEGASGDVTVPPKEKIYRSAIFFCRDTNLCNLFIYQCFYILTFSATCAVRERGVPLPCLAILKIFKRRQLPCVFSLNPQIQKRREPLRLLTLY